MNVCFTNDNNTTINLIKHPFTEQFKKRNNHEVKFRQIHSYLIRNKIIKGNIIDLGAWIGDNSIPWAKQIDGLVYAIDPSPNNINFIKDMCIKNKITNIKTIQKPISDKNEIVSTNHNIDHCFFLPNKNGKKQVMAVSLDYLLEEKEIENIDYIHLDVEGFEYKVIKGAEKLINLYKPIVAFEQHIDIDNYLEIISFFEKKNYTVFMINEILPKCRYDCRNFLAFPPNSNINIDDINKEITNSLLLSSSNIINNLSNQPTLIGNISGSAVSETKNGIKSIFDEKNNLHIFAFTDKNFTKFIALDKNKKWILSKYLLGKVNINDKINVITAFNSAQNIVKDKNFYVIKLL